VVIGYYPLGAHPGVSWCLESPDGRIRLLKRGRFEVPPFIQVRAFTRRGNLDTLGPVCEGRTTRTKQCRAEVRESIVKVIHRPPADEDRAVFCFDLRGRGSGLSSGIVSASGEPRIAWGPHTRSSKSSSRWASLQWITGTSGLQVTHQG